MPRIHNIEFFKNGYSSKWKKIPYENSLGPFGTFNVLIAVITIAPLDFSNFLVLYRSLSCKDIYNIVCDVL